jgi:predicted thioesterase
MGDDDARVLSTPEMIRLMERTSRDLVLPLLDSGHDTVGTHVNVYHRAAAPLGSSVTFTSEVLVVDGRRIQFRVEATTEAEKIGEGTHERTIVNVAKFAAKQAEKRR